MNRTQPWPIALLVAFGLLLPPIGCAVQADTATGEDPAATDDTGPPLYGNDGLQELTGKSDSADTSSLQDTNAMVLESRYASIRYFDRDALDAFNGKLYMGRLRSQVTHDGTLEGEVMAKLDLIVDRVQSAMDMYLPDLHITVVIHANTDGVHKDFRALYGIDVGFIAFYSPSRDALFYSAKDTNLDVVSHEIGHAVAENYFTVSPPQRIHELLAQYASAHVDD